MAARKRQRPGNWHLEKRERANGTVAYRWRYYVGPKRANSPTFDSPEAAQEWRSGTLALGKPAEAGSFEDAALSWLKSCSAAPSTVHDYRQCLQGHLLPEFGTRRLGAISVDDLNAYLQAKQEGSVPVPAGFRVKLATPTLRRHMWIARAVFDHAIYRGKHRGTNPANGRLWVSAKAKTAKEPPALRLDNQRRLWAEIPEEWQPLTSVLLYLGLRFGEASGLDWRNWLPNQGQHGLLVVAGAMKKGGGWGEPKSEYGYRRLAVPPLVRELIDAQRERVGDNRLMFPGVKGGHCSNSYYNQKVLKPAAKRAGIEREIAAHVLRHSFALNQINADVQPSRLCKLMGHHSPSFTLARYGRWWNRDFEPVAMPVYEDDEAAQQVGGSEWVYAG